MRRDFASQFDKKDSSGWIIGLLIILALIIFFILIFDINYLPTDVIGGLEI